MTIAHLQTLGADVYQTSYNRRDCTVGLVHIGYGAFHRSHQAVYFDDYMEATGDLNWGIAAVNLLAKDSLNFEQVRKATDGYLLKTTHPQGTVDLRLVRSHLEFSDWPTDGSQSEDLLSRASVHAVTLTVSESGYYLKDDLTLNVDNPVITAEREGKSALSVYAYLAKALDRRASEIDSPISVLCCDNIRSNGKMLEHNFHHYLELTNRYDLAQWVSANVSFPRSMVDRITPRSTDALTDEIATRFPDQNLFPIHAETFSQWVLEDNFAGPMPELQKVGVQVVANVEPYEEAKIRILNGGHTGLAYLGVLAGHQTFDQAMGNPELHKHFSRWEREEVLPGLDMELPFDKIAYLDAVEKRFCNEAIADQIDRICMDGFTKMSLYIRPTILSCLQQGIFPGYGYKSIASWYVFSRRIALGQLSLTYHEPNWNFLLPLLERGQEENFARAQRLWGELPVNHPEFVKGLVTAIIETEEQWPV